MSAVAHPRVSEERYTSWDRARLSVVVPIGVIVAVAIVCIVVAVLSSAQRADEVAVQHEKLLFSRALSTYGERVLREVKSVAASERAIQNIRVKYDPDWVKQRVGFWLKTYFDHDHVFVFDASDKPVYSQFDRHALDPSWFEAALPDMQSVLDYMRGRNPALHGTLRLAGAGAPDGGPHSQVAVIRSLAGRPAVIAAVAVGPVDGTSAARDIAGADRHVGEIHRQRGARRHRRATAAHASAQARRRAGAAHRLDL